MIKLLFTTTITLLFQCCLFSQADKKANAIHAETVNNGFILSIDDFSKFSNEDFRYSEQLSRKGYTPTCLSNGLLSISPGPNPLIHTLSYINTASTVVSGFVHQHPGQKYEEFAPVPYPLAIKLDIDEYNIRDLQNRLIPGRQELNMNNGELTTELVSDINGNKINIKVVQFASRYIPTILCEKLTFTSAKNISVSFNNFIDGTGADTTIYRESPRSLSEVTPADKPNIVDQVKGYISDNNSKLGVAILLERSPGLTFKAPGHYIVNLKANQSYDVKMLVSMVSDVYHPDPQLESIRAIRWAEMIGFDDLEIKNVKIWRELWKSRVKINGAQFEDQQALDLAFYYLQSNVHASSRLGYSPFGLTQSWAYGGHSFWDTDLWMTLPTLLVQPDAAKAIINYRFNGLNAAINRASLFGFKGAQYPWETCRDGSEVTSSNIETGWAEQHTMGPALAAWEYYLAGPPDHDFLEYRIWPIIKNVTEWLVSRGEFTSRGFEFKTMMGPDEGISNVSNQSYFNLLAKKVISIAIECSKILNKTSDESWRQIAKQIYLPLNADKNVVTPYDPTSKVTIFDRNKNEFVNVIANLKDETYSLGNLTFLFCHGLPLSDNLFRSTYFFEEKIRLKRINETGIPGGPNTVGFVSPAWMAAAAFCGERDKAAELFTSTWKGHLLPPFGMTREVQDRYYGGFITSCGSLLQNTILGLTGLRISATDWRKYPASLPTGWKSIEVDRIWIRGSPYKLIAKNGEKAQLISPGKLR